MNIEKEIRTHQKLNHPYIVKLLDFFQEGPKIYMLLNYLPNGNLFNFITRSRKIKKQLIQQIFFQTVKAMEYIHQEGFILRDLKPENILLDSNNDIQSNLHIKLGLI